MLNPTLPSFPGAMGALESELEALLQSTLQAAQERLLLQLQTSPGEALVATTARIIILKSAANSTSGKPIGRYFPWSVVEQFDGQSRFFSRYIAVITADTRNEQRPFRMARCTFACTFGSGDMYDNALQYLNDTLAAFAQAQRSAYINGTLSPITVAGVVPLSGERFFFSGDAVLFAEHSYRQWAGGTQGVSFRIMRGVYYRVGGIRGQSYDKKVIEPDDRGTLALSDHRMLFLGQRRSIDVPLAKITSVQPFTDGLQVDIGNKAPIQLHTGSDLAGLMLHRLCTNPPP